MENQDSMDPSDEPSLGRDILEQKKAQEQQSVIPPQGESQNLEPEEEEAWWLKYVDDPEEAVIPVAPEMSNDSTAPLAFNPEPVPASLPVFAPEFVPRAAPATPPESGRPEPLKIVGITGGLKPSSRSNPQPSRKKSKSKPEKSALAGGLTRGASLVKQSVDGIFSRKNSALKLWPYAVGILGVVLVTFSILSRLVPPLIVEGKVEEVEQALLATYSGKVETIFVKKWERVRAGEPLVQLQSDKLEGEMKGLAARLTMRHEDLFGQYQEEIGTLNRIIVKAEIDYKAFASENQAIDRQLKNLRRYLEGKDQEGQTIDPGEVKKEGITERISILSADYAGNESKIAQASGEIAAAGSDIGKLMGRVRDLQEKGFLDMANLEEQNQYEKLRGKREQLILTTPLKGSVSDLRFQEGQTIEEGETILQIVSDPDRVEIMIPEERIHEYSVEDFVWIREPNEKDSYWKVPIIVMAPKIDSQNVSQTPGRRVFVSCPPDSDLLPGQKVSVYMGDPDESGLQRFRRKMARNSE